ncbi:hypothetical protein ALCH109712_03135 [Alkalicoccus chagannorensis]
MPEQTKKAIEFAKSNEEYNGTNHSLVDLVRKYFNDNNINYSSFSYKDLEPFLN